MLHRIASHSARISLALLIALFSLLTTTGRAQNLAFNPGTASTFAGDPTGVLSRSPASFTGPVFTDAGHRLVLGLAAGTALDSYGNVYIADTLMVRVVASGKGPIPALPSAGPNPVAQNVYAVAGTQVAPPASGSSPCGLAGGDAEGNGCPGPQAPAIVQSVAVDSFNNVFITGTAEVRVIYSGAGPVPNLPAGAVAGDIYKIAAKGTTSPGSALSATFLGTKNVYVDSKENIYVIDANGSMIYEIYAAGSIPGVSNPVVGNIYPIAGAKPICATPTDACGDGGPAAAAALSNPLGVTVDASGNIYIADNADNRVRAIYAAGNLPGATNPVPGNIYTVAGTGVRSSNVPGPENVPAIQSTFGAPTAVALDAAGNLYVGEDVFQDKTNTRVRKIDPAGIVTTVFGGSATPCATAVANGTSGQYGDGCASNSANLAFPAGLAIDSLGNLFIADSTQHLIRESSVALTTLPFASTVSLPSSQVVTVYNTGTQPLQLAGIVYQGDRGDASFSQSPTGGKTDCSGSSELAPGASCQIGITYLPPAVGSVSGSVVVSSNSLNATGGKNSISVFGTAIQATSKTSLAILPKIANVGEPVVLTATIIPQFGTTIAPTGTVTYISGSMTFGTATVSGGVATLSLSDLPAGPTTVTASYSGDANFVASASFPESVTVSTTPVPVVTLAASPSTINLGQSVTLTVTVAPYSGTVVPTGSVSFQDGVSPLGSATLDANGQAIFTTSSLPAGVNTLVAVYNPATFYASSISAGVPVTVAPGAVLSFTPGIISDVAGLYKANTYSGDGGPATAAGFKAISGVTVDIAGNIYIADPSNFVVRVVASGSGPIPGITNPVKGNVYTVAGTPTTKCADITQPCGDGGPAIGAMLNTPKVVYVDAFGNLYIADFTKVREVSAKTGIITTLAGTGAAGFAGDNGPATAGRFSSIGGLYVDNAGNIFISDGVNQVIREVDALSGIVTTVAGTNAGSGGYSGDGGPATVAKLAGPRGIAVDISGNLFTADTGNQVVRRVDGQTNIITTFAGWHVAGLGYTGDGGPATEGQLATPSGVAVDAGGNLYIADTNNNAIRGVNAQTGIITTLAGLNLAGVNNQCVTAPCGDGGPATSARLFGPNGVALDPQGNIYIADQGNDVVREVTTGTTALTFGNLDLGSTTTQTVTVTNNGKQPLTFTELTFSDNFAQGISGGNDCTADQTLAPGAQCLIGVNFSPLTAGPITGTMSIANNSTNAANGQNVVTLSGTGNGPAGTQTQTITFPALNGPFTYGQQVPLSASSSAGSVVDYPITYVAKGAGTIVNNSSPGATLKITGIGNITVTAYQFGDNQYKPAAAVQQTIQVNGSALTITAADISIVAGQPIPQLTDTVTGLVNGDTQSVITGTPVLTVVDTQGTVYPVGSIPPKGSYNITVTQGTLSAPAYYTLNFVSGKLNVTGNQPQTITFAPLPANITYGQPLTIVLSATASSGLPVSYTPSSLIVGNVLTIPGAGVIAVTADQGGNDAYAAAPQQQQTIQVAKAPLTLIANNITVTQAVPLPVLSGYSITGFVGNDTQSSSTTGNPVLVAIDPSHNNSVLALGSTPPAGTYPITIAQGTLASANYTFSPINGTLTVIDGKSQTIAFAPLPNVTYGAAPITLTATATSGLGVSYSVSGPATITANVLSTTGAGTVKIVATQAGNNIYAPISATQSFTVAPAVLTVKATDVTRVNNVQNSPLTAYTLSGFVNGDTQGSVSGTPAITTTAQPGSPVGDYPIAILQGALTAANYTFTFVNGTLHIVPGGSTPDFSLTANPQQLTMLAGQVRQSVITLSPINYYQGIVTLSCGTLPANVSCVFSPATLTPDGRGVPVTTSLTVNTNGGLPVVGAVRSVGRTPILATMFYLPGGVAGLLLVFSRRRLRMNTSVQHLLVLLVLLTAAMGMSACGSSANSSTNSQFAQPGTSTVTVTAGDGKVSHALDFSISIK
jgi:sugar lactone lactonase YvrE